MVDILFWLWRRIWLLPVLLMLFLLAGAAAYTEAGRFVSSPVDAPEQADLIAALGGESANRPKKAAELHAEGFAPRIFLTGQGSTPRSAAAGGRAGRGHSARRQVAP